MLPSLREVALAEWQFRAEHQRMGMIARRVSASQADNTLRHWAALAAWFGASLPDRFRDCDGNLPLWIDFYPPATPSDVALRAMVEELRLSTARALAHHRAHPDDAQHEARTGGLMRLIAHMAPFARITPVDLTLPAKQDKRAA